MADNYRFDLPINNSAGSIIKVVGVGGGGSNAVSHMYNQGIKDVEFVVCNTDAQALKSSPVPTKLQIGWNLTEGLGAGANPEVGMNAAIETKEEIRELLAQGTKMLFVTAGMGGGTGTGAAPVIAKIAKDMDILTVGIVTAPFTFEGKRKVLAANEGVRKLKEACDTVLVISNDKLREIYGNQTMREAFKQADNVLTTAAKSIAEIITVTNNINVDFKDVTTVMRNSGPAVMGSAVVAGDNRAIRAIEGALTSPLLNNTDIRGAKKILLSMTYGDDCELTMDEMTQITDYIQEKAGLDADMIWGEGSEASLEDALRVTIIATGFADTDDLSVQGNSGRRVFGLESGKEVKSTITKRESSSSSNINSNVSSSNYSDRSSFDDLSNDRNKTNSFFEDNLSSRTEENTKSFIEENSGFNVVNESTHQNTSYNNHDMEQQKLEEQRRIEEQKRMEDEKRRESMVSKVQERIRQQRLQQLQQQKEREERMRKQQTFHNEARKKEPITSKSNHTESYDIKGADLSRPAYERRRVNLQDVPHSSENNISRFNLNDDDELLGNNRYLHDNVD